MRELKKRLRVVWEVMQGHSVAYRLTIGYENAAVGPRYGGPLLVEDCYITVR
jgi:hypothetical protein